VLKNKARRDVSTTKTAAVLMVESFDVLLKSTDLSDAYELLSIEYHYKKTQRSNNFFDEQGLTSSVEKFSSKLLIKLDNDELLAQENGAEMLWFLYDANLVVFGKLAEFQARFEKWFSAIQDDCVKRRYSGGQTVSYHQIYQDHIDKLGGGKTIFPYLNAIEDRGNLTPSQLALIKAFKNPGSMFDPANAMQLNESDL
jgi:hypothetical protein